jgi:Tol biopolymer transport system component
MHVLKIAPAPLIVALALGGSADALASAFPGRNGRLVYQPQAHTGELHSVRPDGSHRRFIAGGAETASFFDPDYSANGRWIAASDSADVWIMRSNGRDQRQLPLPLLQSEPTWSPGGRWIAFEQCENYSQQDETCLQNAIYKVRVDGAGLEQLAAEGQSPSWSPDGKRIAFYTGCELMIMRADGSNAHPVIERGEDGPCRTPFESGSPDFSPGGGRLAFAYDRVRSTQGYSAIYTVHLDGRGLTRVSRPGNLTDTNAAWSPDGRWIAFTRAGSSPETDGIYKVRPSGGRARRVGPWSNSLDWQPRPRR